MKSVPYFVTLVVYLLSFAALPCSARSGRRAGPPAVVNTPSLNMLTGLNGSLCVLGLFFDFTEVIQTDTL